MFIQSGIWNNAQLNYSTIKKEILSIVLCISNPTKMAVATNSIMQVMNIKLKLLVIESKLENLQ